MDVRQVRVLMLRNVVVSYAAAVAATPQLAREEWQAWQARRPEHALWENARQWSDLCELTAQFIEGKRPFTPNHHGPREDETVQIAAPLAHANRRGFLTTTSQPAISRYGQRASVCGWAGPETVEQLGTLTRDTRLKFFSDASGRGWARRPAGMDSEFAYVPGSRSLADFDRPDLIKGALWVTVYDPEFGDDTLLWDRLAQSDWEKPMPPTPAQRRPQEPPVGTVLETRDHDDVYRIERLPEGWAIQYRAGENEFGATHTTGRISWPSAWSAWGPPAGAGPLVPVAADAPPLPPHPPEPVPAWVSMGTDASEARFDPSPAAQPHRPPVARSSDVDAAASRDPYASTRNGYEGLTFAKPPSRETVDAFDDLHFDETGDERNPSEGTWEKYRDRQLRRQARGFDAPITPRPEPTPLRPPVPTSTTDVPASPPPTAQPYRAPAASTTTSSGAGSMASIEEVRAGISLATDKAGESLGALQQAHATLEEAQGSLMRATAGSSQADASDASGLIAQALGGITEIMQSVSAAITTAGSLAARL